MDNDTIEAIITKYKPTKAKFKYKQSFMSQIKVLYPSNATISSVLTETSACALCQMVQVQRKYLLS
jgi:hypothetical protein